MPNSTGSGTTLRPFKVPWLDSCFQQTVLPGSPWHQVCEKLCEAMADRIRKQLSNENRRNMIFEMVGYDFVKKYFSDQQYETASMHEEEYSKEQYQQLRLDAQNWLQNTLTRVCQDINCLRPSQIQHGMEACEEMKVFMSHTHNIVQKGLDRDLHLGEKQLIDSIKDEKWHNYQKEEKSAEMVKEIGKLQRSNPGLRSILKVQVPGTAFSTSPLPQPPNTALIRDNIHQIAEVPSMWGMESNHIGLSVVAILQRDPRLFPQVAARLHGHQLPATLRSYIWMDGLLLRERHRLGQGNVERTVRERFGMAVSRGVVDMKITRATHSPISSLIDNAIIELYDKTWSLRDKMEDNNHMKQAAKTLNVLYVYDRTYEPYLVYWLYPLQVTFKTGTNNSEHVYELAMYLDLLNKSSFPTWPQVYSIAERGFSRLAEADYDPDLHVHLTHISKVKARVSSKDFIIQMLQYERSKGLKEDGELDSRINQSPKPAQNVPLSAAELSSPVLLLRKWIGEGFVSVLDSWTVLWAWDQCFLQRWNHKVLEDIALALLGLLTYNFYQAHDYTSMKQVFLEEPCKLFTKDVQQAWLHLQDGGSFRDIPAMNRLAARNQRLADRRRGISKEPVAVQAKSPTPVTVLPDVGLKSIQLDLALKKDLAKLNAAEIEVTFSIFYGSVLLASRDTAVPAESVGSQVDQDTGLLVHQLQFPNERVTFTGLDITQYDVEREMGAAPYVMATVKRVTKQTRDTLGMAKIIAHTNLMDANDSLSQEWCLSLRDASCPLSLDETELPTQSKFAVEAGSKLGCRIYDPNKPVSITPAPPPPPSVTPGINDIFDFYIDQVLNIPDDASIIKVTGRFLKTGEYTLLPDILALPVVDSSARSPRFRYKLTVNANKQHGDINLLILLRVYTISLHSGALVNIGSCLFDPFSSKGKLKLGGHQRSLRNGRLDLSSGIDNVNASSMNGKPRIPACSISFRCLSHIQEYSDSSTETSYQFGDAPLNASEKMVLRSYSKDSMYPAAVKDMMKFLQEKDAAKNIKLDKSWLQQRLEFEKQGSQPKLPEDMRLERMVRYRAEVGVCCQISKAYGLPEGVYTQCFTYILESSDQLRDEKFVTKNINLNSLQSSPVWNDPVKLLKPEGHPYAVLLIQMFGLRYQYKPTKNHKTPGKLSVSGQPVKLGNEASLAWTAVPIFDGQYVMSGEHHVPLIKGKPSDYPEILSMLQDRPVSSVFTQAMWKPANLLPAGGLVVFLWDGHFKKEHRPFQLKVIQEQQEAMGELTAYQIAENSKTSPPLYNMVLDSLEKKYKKLGTASDVFNIELEFFTSLSYTTFYELLENELMEAGHGPL